MRDLLVVAVTAHAAAVSAGIGRNAVQEVAVEVIAAVGVAVDASGARERGGEWTAATYASIWETDSGIEVAEEIGHCSNTARAFICKLASRFKQTCKKNK